MKSRATWMSGATHASPTRHRMPYGEALLVLDRRVVFLRERISRRRPGTDGYDRQELAALGLAVSCLEAAWSRERETNDEADAGVTDRQHRAPVGLAPAPFPSSTRRR